MGKHFASSLLLLLAGVSPALADEEISYTNVEAGYATSGGSAGEFSNGFSIGGSIGFAEHLFAFGSIHAADQESDEGFTTTATNLGLGYHWGLAPALDLVAGLSSNMHVRFRDSGLFSETGTGSVRHDGLGVHAGLRSRIGEKLELSGGVKYTDYGHGVNDYTWMAGGRIYFTSVFAAGFDVSDNDDGTVWKVALRFDFTGLD
jgi:hypothetical protein